MLAEPSIAFWDDVCVNCCRWRSAEFGWNQKRLKQFCAGWELRMMSFLGGKKQREQWEFHPFWLDGCGWWGLPMLPQRIWIHCCHLLLDNVSCKSHFAQAKDTVLSGFFRTSQTSWKEVMVGDLLWRRRRWMMTTTIKCFFFHIFWWVLLHQHPQKTKMDSPNSHSWKAIPLPNYHFLGWGCTFLMSFRVEPIWLHLARLQWSLPKSLQS